MSVWRAVQEALYQRFVAGWVTDTPEPGPLTPYCFEDDKFDPPDGPWVRFSVKRMPGGPGTLGGPGRRKMDRVGHVFVQIFQPPGTGNVGGLSDLGEFAAGLFENCRLEPADIRFGAVEPGPSAQVESGRWLGLVVEGRFEYEQHN